MWYNLDFNEVGRKLQYYEFSSLMKQAQRMSVQYAVGGLGDLSVARNYVLPWQIEMFTMQAILSKSNHPQRTIDQNEKFLREILSDLHSYLDPSIDWRNPDSLNKFLIFTGNMQFQIQQNPLILRYRCRYLFNFINDAINMPSIFIDKFGICYELVYKIGLCLEFIFHKKVTETLPVQNILNHLLNTNRDVINFLTITVEEVKERQSKLYTTLSQQVLGFKIFNQFPFILDDETIYLPLPHLLLPATTTSLVFRLTEGDATLRGKYGKHVLESYVFHISTLNSSWDEIKQEKRFERSGGGMNTLDVMMRSGNKCLLVDSKSTVPNVGVRVLVEKDIERMKKKYIEQVIQVYKHITRYFQNIYNPFDGEPSFLKENVFGAVIINEDGYLSREEIYEATAEKLGFTKLSPDYNYLCAHVKIFNLYQFESMNIQQLDIIRILERQRNNRQDWFNFSFIEDEDSHENSYEFLKQWEKEEFDIITEWFEELQDKQVLDIRDYIKI